MGKEVCIASSGGGGDDCRGGGGDDCRGGGGSNSDVAVAFDSGSLRFWINQNARTVSNSGYLSLPSGFLAFNHRWNPSSFISEKKAIAMIVADGGVLKLQRQ
ncbi:hypothetical protein OIU79_010103 [Salix purpurea]|uniref:Uncharacterized protein n=1 Tax=Salix purpurea TaxID=77065 RepID=A0A9Q0QEU0_SALPP|nr:hypothetical protein OIU79_010103 [Salix purpurea]